MTTKPGTEPRANEKTGRRTRTAWLTATFLGVGHMPVGPGTWAAAVTIILWYFCVRGAHAGGAALAVATLIAAIAVTLIGIPAASVVERESGRQDPGFVVLDEVGGQLTALILAPTDALHVLLAFVLFRFFDILKPPPVRQLDRHVPGGLGIMVDDVGAGVYALIIGLIVHHWW